MSEVERIYVFKRFERLWHWTQAILIIFMALTGFEIHGTYQVFGFATAVDYHTFAAWLLIGLWIFGAFWHLTTGEWRQYIPTREKLMAMVLFYSVGIFKDTPHPFKPSRLHKHNPLQRMAYLMLLTLITPLIWVSGLLYLFFNAWADWGLDGFLTLEWVAAVHVFAGFLVMTFLVAHMYLITTGHTVLAQMKAMITGWDEVEK